MIGETWYKTSPMRNLRYLLSDSAKNKELVQQFDFIGEFPQANVKHRVIVKSDSIYGEYFPDYAKYFGRPLRLNKLMYGMTSSGNLFADEPTNFMIN